MTVARERVVDKVVALRELHLPARRGGRPGSRSEPGRVGANA